MRSVLQSDDVDLEVIVLDDGSTDRTAEIVRDFVDGLRASASKPPQPLPAGWCGKNFACHQLAALARHPLLVFMDADVRVSRPDSLARLAEFVEQSGAALVSGVPREETRGLMEKLIIPLIHFVLLGFLPLRADARTSTDPRFAAACGQILAVRRDAYERAGGHAAIADRIHDAVALTRIFRAHGFATDLFDATDTFHCRMYQRAAEVWNGFAKNAHEGLGSPRLIVPATLLLLGGQVLPLVLLVRLSPLALARSSSAPRPHSSRASSPSCASASRSSVRCSIRSASALSSRSSGSPFSALSVGAPPRGRAVPTPPHLPPENCSARLVNFSLTDQEAPGSYHFPPKL